MNRQIRTLNDLIMEVCRAIKENDIDAVEHCDQESRDWMIDPDQRIAINTLIDTAISSIESSGE